MATRRPASLTKLIDTLSRVFPGTDAIRAVSADAAIHTDAVRFDQGPAAVWTEIVNEAIKSGAVDVLVEKARQRYDLKELRDELAAFRRWTEAHAGTPAVIREVASKPPPGFFERARIAILAWSTIGLGCFAFVGIIARQSRVTFIGLPLSGLTHVLDDPEEAAVEGLLFFSRIGTAALEYVVTNPIGAILAIAFIAAVIVAAIRKRERLQPMYVPAVVVPVVAGGAILKSLAYDVPLWEIRNVLVDYSLDSKQFEIPSLLAGRAESLWRNVVCSRVANHGGAFVEATCGGDDAQSYLQNSLGAFMADVLLTVAVCVAGVATVRKLLLPSRHVQWNLSGGVKWLLVAVTGAAMLFALLPVPATYARTVASTEYPQVCGPDGRCFYRMCVDEDRCFHYDLDSQEIVSAKSSPNSTEKAPEDVLRAWLTRQLRSHIDTVPPRATRFGGGPL